MEARDSFCFPKNTKNPNPSPIGKKFGFCCCGAPSVGALRIQSPRDEHERLHEVRVRPEGNGAAKKPQHSLRLFWCTIGDSPAL